MGALGGVVLGPVAINDKGQATGTAFDPSTNINYGVLWQDGVASDLGSLPGYPQVHGNSINDRGQIVGQTCDPAEQHCTVFLWQHGVQTDLNTVVPAGSSLYMFDPAGINFGGEIVGLAIDCSTGACCHAFLAIPDDSVVTEDATPTAESEATQRHKPVLPENVRKMLQQRRGFGRLLGPAITPSTN